MSEPWQLAPTKGAGGGGGGRRNTPRRHEAHLAPVLASGHHSRRLARLSSISRCWSEDSFISQRGGEADTQS